MMRLTFPDVDADAAHCWMDRGIETWMGRWMDRWVKGWMNGWMERSRPERPSSSSDWDE